ncbi:hypothetical protein [Bradyrhizobium tunisiense]|uniref:hypothetical protein n=1 Tax=Bradyrhizobium tunisiense TaxID=3278709 RepID=UPI0035DB5F59
MTPPEIADPHMVTKRKKIIADILDAYDITREELLGNGRGGGLMEARRDAANRLLHAGFNKLRIARILRRNHTTIGQYFNESMGTIKRDRIRVARLLDAVPHDARSVITAVAEADGVHPYTIVREWLVERARFEAEAKARVA